MDGWMDGWMHMVRLQHWMDGWMVAHGKTPILNGLMDGWMDGWMDEEKERKGGMERVRQTV